MSKKRRRNEELRLRLAEDYSKDLLFADDHDNAIIGVIERCGQEPFLLYNREIVVSNLMSDGCTEEEAEEWVDFNWNAWVGENTPALLEKIR